MEPIKCQEKENPLEDLKFAAGYLQYYFYDVTNDQFAYSKSHWPKNKILAKQVDTIAVLRHVNTQLAQLQRDEIKLSLKGEYSAVCSAEVLFTGQYLFEDDLANQLQAAKEASKISLSFPSSSKTGPFKGTQQTSNQHDHFSKGPKRHRTDNNNSNIYPG